MDETGKEIAYYREVEDFFAAARGVPHTLSPRDVQLLRTWWRDQIPIEAVTTAITEVLARRRESGDDDPAVSLSYCRHAVRRQAKRLAAMRVGQEGDDSAAAPTEAIEEALEKLRRHLVEAADRAEGVSTSAADVIAAVASRLVDAAALDTAAQDRHLFNLETTLIEGCIEAMPVEAREHLDTRARKAAAASGATGETLERAYRAMLDREVRTFFGLPRLNLV